jgi:hypothetical protein
MALPIAKPAYFEGISFRPDGWAERQNAAEDLTRALDALFTAAAEADCFAIST